jgi:hypothetical protein
VSNEENGGIVKMTNEARAGHTGDGVRYVLIWGTISVIVLFAVVYFAFFPGKFEIIAG